MSIQHTNRELLKQLFFTRKQGTCGTIVTQITHDSRKIIRDSLFVAIPGEHVDGHDFISQTIKDGARTIIHQTPLDHYDPEVLYLAVPSSRSALSQISAWFYGTKDIPMKIIGVTGTDGKSSTCHFLYELLLASGLRPSLLSTVSYDDGSGIIANPTRMTTPEAPDIHSFLASSYAHGTQYAILETSSHALSKKTERLADIQFDIVITTSLTSDHLDFHENVVSYIDDKLSIFKRLTPTTGIGIAQRDGNHFEKIVSICDNLISYSLEEADLQLYLNDTQDELIIHSSTFDLDHTVPAPFKHPFFLLDAAAAITAALSISPSQVGAIVDAIPKLELIKGRGKEYRLEDRLVIFDYAHTPDSFRNLFSYYHLNQPDYTSIIVFGAAGSRDHTKRSLMGIIAANYGRLLIITSEDPRDEDPQHIYDEICSGMSRIQTEYCISIPDRAQAIAYAFEASHDNDMLFFLGKGHESSIQIGGKKVLWNEQKIIEEQIDILIGGSI